MTTKLFAPHGYWLLTPEEKSHICNGMGAKDSLLTLLIPNCFYGLDMSEAGNIHDYMYSIGLSAEDKRRADDAFLNNMMRLVNTKGGWLAWLRRRRAILYYEAVHYAGGPAFWQGKNRPQEYR